MKHTIRIKAYLSSILLLLLTTNLFASSELEKAFIEMPGALFPSLNKQQRLELLEYYKAGQGDSIKNRFGSQTRILQFEASNSYLKIKTSRISTWEMLIFHPGENRSPIIGIIRSVCAPVCSSSIDFFDNEWQHLKPDFKIPDVSYWLKEEKLKQSPDSNSLSAVQFRSMNFLSYRFDALKRKVIVQNNNLDYLTEEDKRQLSPYVKTDSLVLNLQELFP